MNNYLLIDLKIYEKGIFMEKYKILKQYKRN